MLTPDFIMSAKHVHNKVQTEADYRQRQRETIAANRAAYPNLPWKDPWISHRKVDPFVSAGTWMAECPCKNCVVLAPGWGPQRSVHRVYALGLCFECGAVYEAVPLPEAWQEIEAILVSQRNLAYRYWNPRMSVHDLRQALVDPTTVFRFTIPEDHS